MVDIRVKEGSTIDGQLFNRKTHKAHISHEIGIEEINKVRKEVSDFDILNLLSLPDV